MNKNFEPDDKFVEKLEWQLASEYRRANRLRPAVGRIAVPRGLAIVLLAVGFLTTGVTVIKASEMIKDSWRKKIEVARAGTDIRLAQARLEAVRSESARTKRLFLVGVVSNEENRLAELDAALSELNVTRAQVGLAEVEATGEASCGRLSAPTAG
ncbi:MAG: hypothetical protein PHI34_02850 [Acidobacteriota bacterium]|nr:hypothetical protein [Acidobacteriota bacterium]